ncbi:hypothetical protein EB354_01325 [Chryseobacterium balustinum]|nr:hypothetical protein EB354_01325 [Chryseobacterium balustinum]
MLFFVKSSLRDFPSVRNIPMITKSFIFQLSTINYQLSTINYQLSTINYQLSTKIISHTPSSTLRQHRSK